VRRHVRPICIGAVALLTLVLLAGCVHSGPTWVDSGSSYALADLSQLYAKADISRYESSPASHSVTLRHDALTALRSKGDAPASAADLITRNLPADTRGVPVYVEKATVNDAPAYIIIEATGPANGNLTTKRMWVLSDKGAVVFVGTR
jgi:hypothetical protein